MRDIIIENESFMYDFNIKPGSFCGLYMGTIFYKEVEVIPAITKWWSWRVTPEVVKPIVLFEIPYLICDTSISKEEMNKKVVSAYNRYKDKKKREEEIKDGHFI